MSPLHAWVLAASTTLAPGRPVEPLAEAIATRVEAEDPLFRGDEDRRRTASFLVAIAFRESSLRHDAVGDFRKGKPTSYCAFQVHTWDGKTQEGWTGPELAKDPDKCVTVAMRMLRASVKACPAHPLASYAEGPKGCASPRGQRISRDRLAIAQRLVKSVPFIPVTAEESPPASPTAPPSQTTTPASRPPSEERRKTGAIDRASAGSVRA